VRTWDSRRTLPIREGDFEIIQTLYGARIYIEDGTYIKSKKGRGKSSEEASIRKLTSVSAADIFKLGELKADMSEFPGWELFERRPAKLGDGGDVWVEFEYRLRIRVEEAKMIWEMLLPPRGVFPEGDSETWNDSQWFAKRAELDLNPYMN